MRLVTCKRTLLLLVGVLCPAVAQASDLYPFEIDKQYAYVADCTLCHAEAEGRAGTVHRPFGQQVIYYGAVGKDPGSLASALAQMEAAGRASDADQDEWGDIEELRNGTNPNDYYDPPEAPPTGTTSGSGGTGTEAATTGGSGGNAGAGEPDTEAVSMTSTTGRTRPPPQPRAELPPELKTGCHFGAASRDRAPWAVPALLLGAALVGRRRERARAR